MQPSAPVEEAEAAVEVEGDVAVQSPEPTRLMNIREECDIERLSPRQLKELLTVARVDYRGCVEKQELVVKVRHK